jgi:hypothetical protein
MQTFVPTSGSLVLDFKYKQIFEKLGDLTKTPWKLWREAWSLNTIQQRLSDHSQEERGPSVLDSRQSVVLDPTWKPFYSK